MWHTLLLGQWADVFYWLPIEELIKERQADYYRALGESDQRADSTVFIETILEIIQDSLRGLQDTAE